MRLSALAAAVTVLALAAFPAAAMTFEKITGPAECAARTCIAAVGEIDSRSAQDFQRFARANGVGPGDLVALDSGGGNLVESLALGAAFRSAGVATTVRAHDRRTGAFRDTGACASACVYAFLGGVERSVAPRARLGVHQVAAATDETWMLSASDSQWLMSLAAVHMGRMGARLELLTLALRTRPNDMRWLSNEELVRYAVVTGQTVG